MTLVLPEVLDDLGVAATMGPVLLCSDPRFARDTLAATDVLGLTLDLLR